MKLLIITQKVDKNDPVLGFFHRWIEEFAKHYEKLTVICLQKGEYNLPANVRILSLGKEKGISRLKYPWNFYRYICQERKNYDAVFVHMNQEYILLGGLFWKILGKKIFLWRNHPRGNFLTKTAVYLSNRVFCTSSRSYTAKFSKTELMPVGIDTDYFCSMPEIKKIPNSILFLGRISPIKKPDLLLELLKILRDQGVKFIANFYGDPLPQDKNYYETLKKYVIENKLSELANFHSAVPNYQTREIYNQHQIFVNLTETGSMDKTIFEALACETIVVTSNQALRPFLDNQFIFTENDPTDLADKLSVILHWPEIKKLSEGVLGREKAKTTHDLSLLVKEIKKEIFAVVYSLD